MQFILPSNMDHATHITLQYGTRNLWRAEEKTLRSKEPSNMDHAITITPSNMAHATYITQQHGPHKLYHLVTRSTQFIACRKNPLDEKYLKK